MWSLITNKGIRFKAKVKEYVEASPDGSGVPVFLYIDDPEFNLNKYKVAVGFSCRVVLHIESASFNEGAVLAPLSAIVASEENNDKLSLSIMPSRKRWNVARSKNPDW